MELKSKILYLIQDFKLVINNFIYYHNYKYYLKKSNINNKNIKLKNMILL